MLFYENLIGRALFRFACVLGNLTNRALRHNSIHRMRGGTLGLFVGLERGLQFLEDFG